MKKYKLIKQYPGSPKVGDIVKGSGREGWYSKGEGYSTYDWTHIVLQPEYWKEVVEKDYEIISYVAKDNPTNITTKRRGAHLHEEYWKIHSVKRLSDGEVFTVGDRVKVCQHGSTKIIDKISEERDVLFKNGIWFVYDSGGCTIDHAIKQPHPIFLTHNGKDIFTEDIVWYVNKENFYHDYIKAYPEVKFNSEIRAYFLTEEEAKKYIIENKPALSIKEFWEITWMSTSNFNKNAYMKDLVKERLGIK